MQYMRSAYQKAIDIYLLTSFVGMRLVNIIFSLTLNIVFFFTRGVSVSKSEFNSSNRLKMLWTNYDNYASGVVYINSMITILSITILILLVLIMTDFMIKMSLVHHFRYRWYKRRKISWTIVNDTPRSKRTSD